MNFINTYLMLENLNRTMILEATQNVGPIDLTDCRMIATDVKDLRGELETNACLIYNNELTRVQVRTVIIRDTNNGKEFLAIDYGSRFGLPGGGYDVAKDRGDIVATAKREAYEEFNLNLTDVKDTGVRTWRHREDRWVHKHVSNPEDRWTGYYSYYVVGKASSSGDNENPEELNKWTWYPISNLRKVNKDVYEYVMRLDEAWGDGLHGEQDLTEPGKLSYCCENPINLLKILESGLIKAASVPETHETDRLPQEPGKRGKGKPVCYHYVSFSKQLYSHAYRRPNKWSFGVVLDEASLRSKGYELTDRDHAYNSLCFEALYELEGGGRYMTKTSLYGFVEINKEVFDIIYAALEAKGARMGNLSSANEIVAGSKNLTRKNAWSIAKTEVSPHQYATANAALKNVGFNTKFAFPGAKYHSMQFMVRLKELDRVKPGNSKLVLDYLLDNTYYNEGELRFWCKNNEPGIVFTPDDLHGVILPKIVVSEDTVELEEAALPPHHEEAVHKILEYVDRHSLDIFTHNAMDEIHLTDIARDRGIKTKGAR